MRRALLSLVPLVPLVVLLLARPAHAQQHAQREPSHFVYTGVLRTQDASVADAAQVPLRSVRFVGDQVEMSLRHDGLRMHARGEIAGLQFHVHPWTRARAQQFAVYVPPNTFVGVEEGSTESRVVFTHDRLGEVTLGRPAALPAWLADHIAHMDEVYTQCDAATLYPEPREEGETLSTEAGQTLFARPVRGRSQTEWQETWARVDSYWVRGFARGVRCDVEPISGGLGVSGEGTSGFLERPPEVLLPRGLRLVSPAYPARVVLQVSVPVRATSWGPGWTSANDDGALVLALPCGVEGSAGRLVIASSQLVPEGAPPRIR